jgi:soluble lytic murein transglycosylase-like protein
MSVLTKMTPKNQPAGMDMPPKRNHTIYWAGGRSQRIQLKLSAKNRLMLLIACLIAFSGQITLYVTTPAPIDSKTKAKAEANARVDVEVKTITYESMFREIAPRYNLDWRLLARIAYQESRFNARAVGKKDEQGLMQIMPVTWAEWSPTVGVSDPLDPYSNVLVGAAYLAFLREYFGAKGYQEQRWMLVAYNWGPDNLRRLLESNGRWDDVPEKQRRYALNILQATEEMPLRWDEIREEPVVKITNQP